MKKCICGILGLLIAVQLFSSGRMDAYPGKEAGDGLVVFVAASMVDLATGTGALFMEEHNSTVGINPASSGTLARQLEQGAEADIFISASKKWMDYVIELGLIEESLSFAENRLVIIEPAELSGENSRKGSIIFDKNTRFVDSFEGYLSMGDPAHVPAGQYALEALEFYGWYDALQDRILPGADVRAALAVVELGESTMGIVYRTDALMSEKVRIIAEFPPESHKPIVYYCGLLKTANDSGRDFFHFVKSSESLDSLFLDYGFSPAEK